MREAAAFLLLVCACGAATWKGRAEDARPGGAHGTAPSSALLNPAGGEGTGEGAGERGFASLEGRAPTLAPGLHQAAERENGGERAELVRATERDACVRVAFQAVRPVTARLLDGSGGVLSETPAAATEGALAEKGPVCIRKGDALSATARAPDGAPVRLKWIAWASP